MFLPFSQMSERLSALWRKLFGRFVKTAFDVSMGSYWKDFFEKKIDNFLNSRTLSKCFWHSVEDFRAGLTEKTIEIFNHYRTLSETFLPFCQKNWSRAARTAFYVFTGTVWKIFFPEKSPKFRFPFLDTERKYFGFSSFFFNGVVNSVFYVSIGTLRWKLFFKKSIQVFNSFADFDRNFSSKNTF